MNIWDKFWDWLFPLPPLREVKAKSKHPGRVLAFARHLITDPRRWTTGVGARMASGSECDPNDERAARFCANGAIDACSTSAAANKAARQALANVICPDPKNITDIMPYAVIANVNDKKGHKAILAALDEAIRRGG